MVRLEKPRLWRYKSGKKKGQLRPKAKVYLSEQLRLYHSIGLTKEEREQQQLEEKLKRRYKRQSAVLTAYYGSERFFDWRVSIINSIKDNTLKYLEKVLMNKWNKWAIKSRKSTWNFVICALEDEFIDEDEASNLPIDKIIWEKR